MIFKLGKNLKVNIQKRNTVKPKHFTSDELIKYKSLRQDDILIPITIFVWPFYTLFYLGIFTIILKYAWAIDISKYTLILATSLFRLWHISLWMIFLSILFLAFLQSRNNFKMRELILSERRKK